MTLDIQHVPDKKRFEARTEAGVAVAEYMQVGNTFIFTHTEVPESLEGQGIGSRLVKYALEYVREHNLSASPLCPFVKSYISRHPKYQALVRMG